MITAAPSTALATIQPAFTDAEGLALGGRRGCYAWRRATCAAHGPADPGGLHAVCA